MLSPECIPALRAINHAPRPVRTLVAIVKKRLGVKASLYTLLQVTGLIIFEKRPVSEAFDDSARLISDDQAPKQLNLFGI